MKLTKTEKKKIEEAVVAAEKRTSGEFVTVIARNSDSYFTFPIMWAALVCLVLPVVFMFVLWLFQIHLVEIKMILEIQLFTFIVLYLVFQIPSVKMSLVPRYLKKNRARQLAREQFFLRGVGSTKDHSGVLFFVSLAEHCVEIIADKGINDKVDKDAWQQIVDEFIGNVRGGQMCLGFTTAVEKCADLMAKHYPYQPGDTNELGNSLVEL